MPKILKGKVISKAGENTVGVEVERIFIHPIYEKRLKKKKKFLAHNTIGTKLGDLVEIVQTRPISKLKKWRVIKILSNVST